MLFTPSILLLPLLLTHSQAHDPHQDLELEEAACSPALIDPSPIQHVYAEDGMEVNHNMEPFLEHLFVLGADHTIHLASPDSLDAPDLPGALDCESQVSFPPAAPIFNPRCPGWLFPLAMSQVTCQGAATSGSRSDLKDKKVLGNFLAKDIKCKKSDLKDNIKKTFSLLLQYSQIAEDIKHCQRHNGPRVLSP